MEKVKHKNSEFNSRRYWRLFLPLAVILLICLRFPIRITIPDLYDDILLYGSISLASFFTGLWIYRRSKWVYRRLLVVVFLCGVMAGWQVADLGILRLTRTEYYSFEQISRYDFYGLEISPDNLGLSWYAPRFNNDDSGCISFWEQLFGNPFIAIRLDYGQPHSYCGG